MRKTIMIILLLGILISGCSSFEECTHYCADMNDCGIDMWDGDIICKDKDITPQVKQKCFDECRSVLE